MKKLLFIPFLLTLPFSIGFGDEPAAAIPNQIDKPKTDNITGGVFLGLTVGTDFISNNVRTDLNLVTYRYDKNENGRAGTPSINGVNFEAKLGLIKTTKNFGIRVYGYYGRGFDNMKTLGLPYKPINADSYYETGYLRTQYYGGIVDLLFGTFQSDDISPYFSIGGGYQFTDYTFSGNTSLGYENTSSLDKDIYTAGISGKKSLQSPLVSVGAGMLMNKHHIFEINLRYIFQNPTILSDSETRYSATSGNSFHNTRYLDGTPITIKQSLDLNFNLTFNYMYIF